MGNSRLFKDRCMNVLTNMSVQKASSSTFHVFHSIFIFLIVLQFLCVVLTEISMDGALDWVLPGNTLDMTAFACSDCPFTIASNLQ